MKFYVLHWDNKHEYDEFSLSRISEIYPPLATLEAAQAFAHDRRPVIGWYSNEADGPDMHPEYHDSLVIHAPHWFGLVAGDSGDWLIVEYSIPP